MPQQARPLGYEKEGTQCKPVEWEGAHSGGKVGGRRIGGHPAKVPSGNAYSGNAHTYWKCTETIRTKCKGTGLLAGATGYPKVHSEYI